MTKDYELMIKSGNIFFMKKTQLKIAYSNFIQELNELFSAEDIKQKIDTNQMIQKFRLKIDQLKSIHQAYKQEFILKNPKHLGELAIQYEAFIGRKPNSVDSKADTEEYNRQVKDLLRPLENETRRLSIKLKRLIPEKKNEHSEEDNDGLMWAVHFVEAVNEIHGRYDMTRKVSVLKKDLDEATKKYNNINNNGKG